MSQELSSTFISPTGRLCKTLILFGKEKYTMLDVEPTTFVNLRMLTKKEIETLTPDDMILSSSKGEKI